jgi:hypothetical protein
MMITPLALLLFVLAQEAPSTTAEKPSAEGVRSRVHELRKTLLSGGEQVRRSESEAIDFYQGRVDDIDRRGDAIQAELAEKSAYYKIALEKTLSATGDGATKAATDASLIREQIQNLKAEKDDLGLLRARFVQSIRVVGDRREDRVRLAGQMDAPSAGDLGGLIPPPAGLAPPAIAPQGALLVDQQLIEDLLQLDPVRARNLLFMADPSSYWVRWPLRPPAEVLARSIPFPPPDLPGQI